MTLEQRAKNIRNRIIKVGYEQQVGHVASALSCVEILTVLFFKIMKPGDKFILSPGHKALALYSTLVEKGILDKIDMDKLGGHPYRNPDIGIDFTTGSLGYGLSLGCGCALAGKRTYVLLSDGDMEEGSTMEAYNFMYEHNLPVVDIIDCNGFSAYRKLRQHTGFDGHNLKEIERMLTESPPLEMRFKTIKGKGIPEWENKLESHYFKVTKEIHENYFR